MVVEFPEVKQCSTVVFVRPVEALVAGQTEQKVETAELALAVELAVVLQGLVEMESVEVWHEEDLQDA